MWATLQSIWCCLGFLTTSNGSQPKCVIMPSHRAVSLGNCFDRLAAGPSGSGTTFRFSEEVLPYLSWKYEASIRMFNQPDIKHPTTSRHHPSTRSSTPQCCFSNTYSYSRPGWQQTGKRETIPEAVEPPRAPFPSPPQEPQTSLAQCLTQPL